MSAKPSLLRVTIMSPNQTPTNYAGDITVAEAWEILKREPRCQLIDCRTLAEWNFVGLPDLSTLGRETQRIEWQHFPSMEANPRFVDDATKAVLAAGATKDVPVLLLCRSGARSRAAAIALTGVGFAQAFNIAGGFEGDLNTERHRGNTNGWKAAGLPWRQT